MDRLKPRFSHRTARLLPGRPIFAILVPVVSVMASLAIVLWFALAILFEASQREMEVPGLMPLFFAVLALNVVAMVLVFAQSARSARRLSAPVQRINVAIQRMRQGDLTHRVHLRRHDELRSVAAELNQLLDWLNENPPPGAKTGGDVFELCERSLDVVGEESSQSDIVELTDDAESELALVDDDELEVVEDGSK